MGGSWIAKLPRARASLALAFALSGCSLDELPPCGAIEIAAAQPRSGTLPSPTVMAISQGNAELIVLRACAEGTSCDADLIQLPPLATSSPPEQLLLTGSGRWLTYVAGQSLQRVDLDAPTLTPSTVAVEFDRMELVGSLRGGDWILYRTWAEATNQAGDPDYVPPTRSSQLFARYVGADGGFPFDHEAKTVRIDAGEFRVAALGHRNVVVRKALGNGQEELYLIRIAPSFRSDEHGSAQIGETLLLAKGRNFSRVIVTSGETPEALGDRDAFPKLPNDTLVIATSGEGRDARTVVYDIRDLGLVGNFEGAVATSLLPLHDIPGLSAVSPDERQLAYVTARGGLALRDLDSQTSCQLRSAQNEGGHVMAGFASDGTLYFQSREDDIFENPEPRIREFDRVYAYDTAAQTYDLLSESPYRRPLRAVPELHEQGLAWAIVASAGAYATLPQGGVESIGFDVASYISRGEASLWVLGAQPIDDETSPYSFELALQRIRMTRRGEGQHELESLGPSVQAPGGGVREFFHLPYGPTDRICVSLAQSSHAAPWATQCSDGESHPTRYLSDTLPFTERD